MALQASGQISASDLSREFGQVTNISLGAYRVSQTVGSLNNLALDNQSNASGILTALIPQSGTIKFSDFYSKRLNIVVDFHSGGTEIRQTARTRYDNGGVTVIGGFNKTRPPSTNGCRVITHVNKAIGSAQGNINNVALRTGGWESNTNLEIQIGPSGQLFGAGGNGGPVSGAGGNGTSGLGIEYPVIVTNRGYIQAGGGGGGGSSAFRVLRRRGAGRRRSDFTVPGQPGGGGGGVPGGGGGGGNAGAGSPTTGGSGGTGTTNGVASTPGGAGGSFGANGASSSAPGGSQGRAIVVFNDGTGVSITNLGTINGPTVNNTPPT
jgi:hypothetical protein